MDIGDILRMVDHTLLKQTAVWDEIKELCDEAVTYQTASVCIPPCYVKQAADYLGGRVKVCTVIGFPNGSNTTASKVFETEDAVRNGAAEIDMVINLGMVKAKNYEYVLNEIRKIKEACQGRVLKVIIETCLLTDEEKIKMCELVTESGADYIKTSTGFSAAGATAKDIEIFAEYVGKEVKIKAAGGISSIADAKRFVELGAVRLGTSRIVKIVKQGEKDELQI